MCFFKRRRAKREAKKQAKLEAAQEEKLLEEEKLEEQKVDKGNQKPKEEKVVKVVEETEEEDVEDIEKETKEMTETKRAAKYHISQNKDEKSPYFKQWRVRKEGSKKTIKHFNTQLEAIDYAQDLADKAGTSIVIHKVDGTIRKQDYSKK